MTLEKIHSFRRGSFFNDLTKGEKAKTDGYKKEIKAMRERGFSYGDIGKQVGLSPDTVKSFCRRNAVSVDEEPEGNFCRFCGKPVQQNPGRKEKKFCSDRCRNAWWNRNLDKFNRKANYSFTCAYCKKKFTAYGNAHRKYCFHQSYEEDRFHG